VKHKYLKKDSIVSVKHKQTDSSVWADLIKVKEIYLQGRKMCVRDGKSTLVWKGTCLYRDPLCTLFPDLFKICGQKDISVFQLVSGLIPISFCRWLTSELRVEWDNIMKDILETQLVSEHDSVSWKLEARGNFSVKSTYNALTCFEGGSSFKNIWKGKIPAKIKLFSVVSG
jgi:hypothetical protein